MLKNLFICLIIFSISSFVYSSNHRKPRYSALSFFSFFSVPNHECAGSDPNETINGTCYSSNDCATLNGRESGTCADGYGVCCIIENSCGNTTNANVSYFVNPNWPQTYSDPSSCTFKVNKINQQICQLRVDFIDFDIVGPAEYGPNVNLKQVGSSFGSINTESNCKDDLFVVTQSNRNQPIPILCGKNAGQHLYIPVDESDSESIAFTLLTGIKEFPRKWRIKITQLPCSLPLENLAPQGCLQYYATNRGLIKTFNFDGQQYLQNIDYSICIRKPKNMCYLTLTNTDLDEESKTSETNTTSTVLPSEPRPIPEPIPELIADRFPIPVFNYSNPAFPSIGRSVSLVVSDPNICQKDHYWVTYPGSNRVCSYSLEPLINPITISTNSHQVIHFHSATWTQAIDLGNKRPKGFQFEYAHSPCTHGFN